MTRLREWIAGTIVVSALAVCYVAWRLGNAIIQDDANDVETY